jgi:hypothetical protein
VGQQVIIGVEMGGGRWKFGFACSHTSHTGWDCVHTPAGVSVVLASLVCVERWLIAHPEHQGAVVELLAARDAAEASAEKNLERGLERGNSQVSEVVENRKN